MFTILREMLYGEPRDDAVTGAAEPHERAA